MFVAHGLRRRHPRAESDQAEDGGVFSVMAMLRSCGAALAALGSLASACGFLTPPERGTSPESGPPDFSGVVLALRSSSGASQFHLLVERSSGDSAVVRIGGGTRLFATTSGGELEKTDAGELVAGMPVDVWTTGVEFRSLPPQYAGTQIVLRRSTSPQGNQAIATNATVRFANPEGGCWLLETPSGTYEPIGFPDAFRTDGLAVHVVFRMAPNAVSICQMGPPVTLDDIRTQ